MSLFSRISDIISANLNEMTESFEDPEKMLKQAIREMDQSIAEATQETAKVLANEKLWPGNWTTTDDKPRTGSGRPSRRLRRATTISRDGR